MDWIISFLGSSIGKKQMMAVTGLAFCFFLTTHLAGNFTMFGGHESFNAYAEKLHSLGPLITLAELGLLFFALVHVGMGLLLFIRNRAARPRRYAVTHKSERQTLGVGFMPYTGVFMFFFIVIHLVNFHFADHDANTISEIVSGVLTNPLYALFYVVSMLVVALHVEHGLWSAFQTVGANHPKYTPLVRAASFVFAIAVAVGYGSLPIFVLMSA